MCNTIRTLDYVVGDGDKSVCFVVSYYMDAVYDVPEIESICVKNSSTNLIAFLDKKFVDTIDKHVIKCETEINNFMELIE